MPKYVITIQQVIDVDADDKKLALQMVKQNPPHKDLVYVGPRGACGLLARKSVKIVSCVEKGKKKNA